MTMITVMVNKTMEPATVPCLFGFLFLVFLLVVGVGLGVDCLFVSISLVRSCPFCFAWLFFFRLLRGEFWFVCTFLDGSETKKSDVFVTVKIVKEKATRTFSRFRRALSPCFCQQSGVF